MCSRGTGSRARRLSCKRPGVAIANQGRLAVSSGAAASVPPAATTKSTFLGSVIDAVAPQRGNGAEPALGRVAELQMPSTREEAFRFTDFTELMSMRPLAPHSPSADALSAAIDTCSLPAADGSRVVLVNGAIDVRASDLSTLPEGIYVGPARSAPHWAGNPPAAMVADRGNVLAQLAAAVAQDVLTVHVPQGTHLAAPLHVVHVSTATEEAGGVSVTGGKLLVVLGAGARTELVEEFVAVGAGPGSYWANSVMEAHLGEGAQLEHSTIQAGQSRGFLTKATLVDQASKSSYQLVDIQLGGSLSRHDVDICQQGPRTRTAMRHFLLSGPSQLHDAHTRLVLRHPDGKADQLHKCIVSDASGRGVFDGNVQVLHDAQRTDASQLSRNLLLAPRATVNVKPNLQIIADDVKCTHGCTVSDLSADEMFYFRSRGIDAATARASLVYSFGAEVVQQLHHETLVSRLQAAIAAKLADAPL